VPDPLLTSALRDAMVEAAHRGASFDEIEAQTEEALAAASREIYAIEEVPDA
jgi:hypothetical protein